MLQWLLTLHGGVLVCCGICVVNLQFQMSIWKWEVRAVLADYARFAKRLVIAPEVVSLCLGNQCL